MQMVNKTDYFTEITLTPPSNNVTAGGKTEFTCFLSCPHETEFTMNDTIVKNSSDNAISGLYVVISPIPICEDGQLVIVTLQIIASEGIAADVNHVAAVCTGIYKNNNSNINNNNNNDLSIQVPSNPVILFINKGLLSCGNFS